MGNNMACCVSREDALKMNLNGEGPYKIFEHKPLQTCSNNLNDSLCSIKSYKEIFENETNQETNYKSKALNNSQFGETNVNLDRSVDQILSDEETKKQEQKVKNEYGDDMTEYIWDGPQDPDEEIESLKKYKNGFEDELFGIKYSKNGIIKFIEKFIAYESPHNTTDPQNAKLWQQKLNTDLIKMYLKSGGSPLNPSQPFTRNEQVFKKEFKLHKLVKAIFDPKCFMQYDALVDSFENLPIIPNKSHGIKMTRYKKTMGCSPRDYVDKLIQFYHDGKYYRFACGVPDSEIKGPNGEEPMVKLPIGAVRGYTNINCAMIYRDPEDNLIHLKTITQMDLKFNVPWFLLNSFLPSSTRKWAEDVEKFYLENHKNL